MSDIVVAGDNGTTAIIQTAAPINIFVEGTLKGDIGIQGIQGKGTAPGGLTDQFLAKNTGADYDTKWVYPFSGYVGRRIFQISHGFTVGQVVYFNSLIYSLSKADNSNNAEVVGMILQIVDSGTFILCTEGYVSGLTGLSPGLIYFLSPIIGGALASVQPTAVGQVSKPIFTADSPTSGYFHNYRGRVIEL